VRTFVQLATERMLPAALAPAAVVGRRYERRGANQGGRPGLEEGPRKTATGGRRVPGPPIRGLEEAYRSRASAAAHAGATSNRGVCQKLVAV
jgi:hypothetical protein